LLLGGAYFLLGSAPNYWVMFLAMMLVGIGLLYITRLRLERFHAGFPTNAASLYRCTAREAA